jgi:hypothetical protein
MKALTKKARALYEDFTGAPGRIAGKVSVPPIDKVLTVVGECEAVAYTAVRDGERASYQHEFRQKSRPLLAVSPDGKRLYLIGGSYRFTERGIEDR